MHVTLNWLYVSLIIFIIIWILWLKGSKKNKNVCVLVLGDLGRSPRMQYHALSFAKEGFTVDFIGYSGSSPLSELQKSSNVKIRYLKPPPDLQNKLPRLLTYVIKVLWQTSTLLLALLLKRRSSYMVLQNPPAIPTIPVCWLYCCLMRARLIIDWHNYAHSIMALSVGKSHFLVKLATFIESFFGRRAHNNFCVTKAMKDDLHDKWGITAEVLYDRPADEFHAISLEEKHELLLRLSKTYNVFKGEETNSTVFTKCLSSGHIQLRAKRPALIVSSTSWTEDEDFLILLNALEVYEVASNEQANELNLPNLICVITGKGVLKEFYGAIIKLKKWNHVKIVTLWLENKDYPKLLASADLGICLHTSSSGLDLPMKVVDMFGCGLPVCAYNFNCLHELVKHEENSLVFSDDKELAGQLKIWFQDFPNNIEQKKRDEKFRYELTKFQQLRWHVETQLEKKQLNDRPIIGILTQEISYSLSQKYPKNYDSYIAASYIKFVEGGGARAAPIWIGQNESYYEDILRKVNGVLFPGGSTYFNQSNGYADAGEIIYRIATRMNEDNDYFPIWGTCLGLELITYLAAGRIDHRTNCSGQKQSSPLEFKPGFEQSRMFREASSEIIDALWTTNITANFHRYCVTEHDLAAVNLTKDFHVISVSHDWNDLEFISALEHTRLPFYGVQFHPEKNIYEWVNGMRIPHGSEATRVGQYFANFFIDEARKNIHNFPSIKEELGSLIYNYPVTFTALKNSSFLQSYMFTNETVAKSLEDNVKDESSLIYIPAR